MVKLLIAIVCVINFFMLYKRDRFISSTSMWIFCYALIFVIYPLYSPIVFKNELLIDFLSLIGILIFMLGNLFGRKIFLRFSKNKYVCSSNTPNFEISFYAFLIFFMLSIFCLIKVLGFDGIISIFNGTSTSKKIILGDNNSSLITFSMHLLVPCLLSMWVSANTKKKKIIRIIALLFYIMESILFGFTRLFMMTVVVIIFFHEVRKIAPKKQLIVSSIALVVIIFLLIFMNFIRCLGISKASDFFSNINIDYVFESTDFGSSYEWFDSLLDYKNIKIDTFAYLKPIFVFIPRSVWHSKPEPVSLQILKVINPSLANKGYSTAGNSVLGEGYALFGYFGMFFNCFLWGLICEFFDLRYKRRLKYGDENSYLNICYYIFSIFIIICGQRGDWSQYMTIVLWFYFLPMYVFSIINSKFVLSGVADE